VTCGLLSRGSQVRVLPGALGETRRPCEIACKQPIPGTGGQWRERRADASFCTSVRARGRILVASRARLAIGRSVSESHAAASARGNLDGAWRNLVTHSAGGRKVAGSNPVAPTSRNRRKRGGFARLGHIAQVRRGVHLGSNCYRESARESGQNTQVKRSAAPRPTGCDPGGRGFESRRSPSESGCTASSASARRRLRSG
jgi:hypothetical protein